jgi:RES domain-containing protein
VTGSLWRVTRRPFANLGGEGARLYGGRWNPVGSPCVYLSSTLSLAVLEVLVHTDPDLIPQDLVVLRVDVVNIEHQEPPVATLPPRWRTEIGNADTQSFGGRWLSSRRTPLLLLPSAVLPLDASPPERNVLLNPIHPDVADLRVAAVTSFCFDARLVSKGLGE